VDQKLVMNLRHRSLTTALLAMVGALAGWSSSIQAGIGENSDLDTIFQFSLAPSGVTMTPDGSWIMGVNQSERPRMRAVRIVRSGEVSPFPNEKMSLGDPLASTPLDAIEALQSDASGITWMLDNGRRSEVPPKVIAWNNEKQRVQQVLYIAPPAVAPSSFVADLFVDAFSPLIFISDPASGPNAALIILDRTTGIARRFLQGNAALQPDPAITLRATRTGHETKRIDGSATLPHCGIRPLIMDRKGQWLYLAAVQSHVVYRLPGALLRKPDVTDDLLTKALERYADKPASASLAIDNKNNLYVGDIEGRAIGVIDPEKRGYKILTSDPRLVWPDGLCFGQDGKLYFYSRTQASVTNPTSQDGHQPATEHSMFRLQPLAPGPVGN